MGSIKELKGKKERSDTSYKIYSSIENYIM